MAKQSIGELHAKITANGQQAITEFQRVDNAMRRSVSRVEAEATKMAGTLKKKFSGAGLGQSIMSGLGIGSGFAAIQTVMDQVTQHFQQQAEFAKAIEESTAKQLDHTRELIGLRQTDDQRIAVKEKELAAKMKEIEAARAQRFGQQTLVGAGFGGMSVRTATVPRGLTAEENLQVHKLTEEYTALNLELEKMRMRQDEKQQKSATDAIRERKNETAKLVDHLRELNEEAAKDRANTLDAIERYRDLGDPMRKYQEELRKIIELEQRFLNDGVGLTEDEAWKAKVAVWADMAEAVERANKGAMTTGTSKAGEYEGLPSVDTVEELTESARELGFAFESAFENAILSGEKFSDVLGGLAEDVARIALRSAITQPLGNWIGGIFSGKGAGGGPKGGIFDWLGGFFADGGNPPVGMPSVVGESGPELIVPRSASTVIPNHALGGDSFHFTYNIAAGVTHAELVPILQMQERRTIAAMRDADRRRG